MFYTSTCRGKYVGVALEGVYILLGFYIGGGFDLVIFEQGVPATKVGA